MAIQYIRGETYGSMLHYIMIFKYLTHHIGIVVTALATSPVYAVDWQPAQLKRAFETKLKSPENGHTYRIQSAPLGKAPPSGYPVLYLLDGDAMMPMAMAMTQSMMNGPNAERSGVLLVAIGYPNASPLDLVARARDYTPPPLTADGKNGSAAKFHDFLHNAVKPMIAAEYPIDEENQAISGHSFGGLYVLYQLFNHPQEFQYYFISSPSIWWDDERILQDENRLDSAPKQLRLSVGEREQPAKPIGENASPRAKKQAKRNMVGNVKALAQRLQTRFPDATIDEQVYTGETHISVIHRALYNNLDSWMQDVSPVAD